MPAAHSITAWEPDPTCPLCRGGGLVCEEHPDREWDSRGHDCGAPGMPCTCIRWTCGFVGPDHPEDCP